MAKYQQFLSRIGSNRDRAALRGIFSQFLTDGDPPALKDLVLASIILSGAETTQITISGACTTGILISSAATADGISLTGANVDGIHISGANTANGVNISGANVTGILISGANTADGISLTGANVDAIHISGANTATAIHISGDQVIGILYDVTAAATDGLKVAVPTLITLTSGITLNGAGTFTTGITLSATAITTGIAISAGSVTDGILISGTTPVDGIHISSACSAAGINLTGANASAIIISGANTASGISISGDQVVGVLFATTAAADAAFRVTIPTGITLGAGLDINATSTGTVTSGLTMQGTGTFTTGITLSATAITTGILLSATTVTTGISITSATTTGLSITGAATDGIKIATGAMTDGIEIASACTNGINISGACTTGLAIAGATTGFTDTETRTMTVTVAAQDYRSVIINNTIAGDIVGAVSKLNAIEQTVTHATTDMPLLRLKCADWTINASKNVKDLYVIQSEIAVSSAAVINGQCGVISAALGMGSSGVHTGEAQALYASVSGSGAGTMTEITVGKFVWSQSAITAKAIIEINNAAFCTAGAGIRFDGDGAYTSVLSFEGLADGTAVLEDNLTAGTKAGSIKIIMPSGGAAYINVYDGARS